MTDQTPSPVNVNVNSEPSFQITLSAVYDEVRQTSGKIDRLAEAFQNVTHEVRDHETRLRAVEAQQNFYVTKAQAAAAFGSFIAIVMAATGLLALILS